MFFHGWSGTPVGKSPSGSVGDRHEARIEGHEARIEALENLLEQQRQRLDDLQYRTAKHEVVHADLRYSQEELCDCILTKSTTAAVMLRAQLTRHRASMSFRAAVQQPELALIVGQAAGLSAARCMSVVSRVHGEGFRAVFVDLVSRCAPLICRLGGFEGEFPSAACTVECYDPVKCRWQALPPMITGRIACAATYAMGNLYVFGGCNAGLEDLSSAECFDPNVGRWKALPRMPAARRLCTAAALAGKLYVFGRGPGVSLSEPLSLCFDVANERWEALPRMPSANLPCVAVAARNQLYLFSCAEEGMKSAPTAERYDVVTHCWEVLPPIPTPRRSFAAACVSGKLYVCGGMSASMEAKPLNTVERLDVSGSTAFWEALPPMRSARGALSAASSRGTLYLFGGSVDDVVPLATAERFDPNLGFWEIMPRMRRESLLCAVTAVDGAQAYRRLWRRSSFGALSRRTGVNV